MDISIHAPREGGDGVDLIEAAFGDISIHAPREGGDVVDMAKMPFRMISIHAPREGGDLHNVHPFLPIFFYFNPRPPRGGRPQRCTVLPADL